MILSMMTVVFILFLLAYPVVGQIELPQSHIVISDIAYFFTPEQTVEWLDDMLVSSFQECIRQCNRNPLYHTFDYNTEPNWCRLFEAEPSPGQITYDPTSVSQAGYGQLIPDLYSAFNHTCDVCAKERYLFCIQNSCQCSWNSFWDGSVCRKQKYAGSLCRDNRECRVADYNLTCVSSNVCTSAGYPTDMCAVNQSLVLFNYTTTVPQPYTQYSFNFTAVTTSVTVTFALFNQDAYWLLDNISLIDVNISKQVINNGDFETGSLTDWSYCNPNSTNNTSNISHSGSFNPQSGQYFYSGAPHPYPDFLSQTISTNIRHLYTLSFWLEHTAYSSKNSFTVTILS